MTMSDPIADMLTRIRNANQALHKTVSIPHSKIKERIAKILLDEGYIQNVEIVENEKHFKDIIVTLKYLPNKERVIDGLKRISKPGLRIYAGKKDLPKVLNGLGIAIISTPQGLMTDREARKAGIGGEVICYVW